MQPPNSQNRAGPPHPMPSARSVSGPGLSRGRGAGVEGVLAVLRGLLVDVFQQAVDE